MVYFICLLIVVVGAYLLLFQKQKPADTTVEAQVETVKPGGSAHEIDSKKCKHCAMLIPEDAKVCPYCRKNQGLTFGKILLLLILIPVVIVLIGIVSAVVVPRDNPKKPPVPQPISKAAQPAQPVQRYVQPQPREITYTVPTPPIIVDAVSLFSEYEANEVRADERYKGRNLQISGYVDSIGKDILDHMYITLNAGEQIFHIQCFFDKSHANKLASLNKGSFVTVVGQCDGKLGNIHLKGCTLK